MISDCSKYEAAIGLQVIVFKEFAAALERQIRSIHKILVECKTLRVDVIDSVLIFAVDNDEQVWQSIRSVRIVGYGQRVEFSA